MAIDIEYLPRGTTGYRASLVGDNGIEVTIDRAGDESVVRIVPKGEPTQAIVGALERYAGHEYEGRRSRNLQKRRHHQKEAMKWRTAAEDTAVLVGDLTDEVEHGWCSDCMTKVDHRLVRSKTAFRTRQYICVGCGSPTGWCDVPRCHNFADRGGGPGERSRFCSEHNNQIPSFEKLTERIASLEDYVSWQEFERINAKQFSTIASAVVAGAVVIGPLAFVSAPAVGGAIGVQAGLQGAAAVSHGLAVLGGGSLASGGLGMAGGTAVVTAAGTGLGAASGATVAKAYVADDKSFGFERVAGGDETTVIFANGFLSEAQAGWGRWERIVMERYPDAAVFRLTWGAKELKSLTSFATPTASTIGAKGAAAFATQATKRSSAFLGPLGLVFTAAGLAKNPWHVARTRATMTSSVLADAIVRADLRNVVLVGFSLGARVMAAAAESLATRDFDEPRIKSIHLLGGAVSTKRPWHSIENAVEDKIWNYWSKDDKILSAVYRAGEAGSKAIGATGIPARSAKIKNVDVSKSVKTHFDHLKTVKLR